MCGVNVRVVSVVFVAEVAAADVAVAVLSSALGCTVVHLHYHLAMFLSFSIHNNLNLTAVVHSQ